MGIKTRIISAIILVIVLTIFGVYFLADGLNLKQFSYISEKNVYNKYYIFHNKLLNIIENEKNILEVFALKLSGVRGQIEPLMTETVALKANKLYTRKLDVFVTEDSYNNYIEKHYIIDDLTKEVITEDVIANESFYNISNYKNNYIIDIYTNNSMIYINIHYAIYNKEKERVTTILKSSITFNNFEKFATDIFSGIDKEIILLNIKNKKSIYSSPRSTVVKKLDSLNLYDGLKFNSEDMESVSISNIEINKQDYQIYRSFLSEDILILVEVPSKFLKKDIYLIGKKLLIYMLLGGLVACTGIVIMLNFLFMPINVLVDNISLALNTKNLSISMKALPGSDELSEMSRWLNIFSSYFQNILYSVKNTISIFKKQSDEIDTKMKNSVSSLDKINKAVGVIKHNIGNEIKQVEISESSNNEIQNYIDTNTGSIEEIENETKNLQSKILDQRVSIEQVVASVEEMSKTIENIDNIIEIASNKSKDLFNASEQNKDKMIKTSLATKELSKAVVFINNFVLSIRSIAKQTNLLAINAAIEASHAGEHSYGFAVVAEEIHKLSEVSNKQADDATKVLQDIEQKISQTSTELIESSENFDMLVSDTKEVTNIMSNVHMASLEQLAAINDMVRSISLLSDASEHIKNQYMSVVDRLAIVKQDLFTLSRLSKNSMQSMTSLRNISDEICSNVESVISESKCMSDTTYDMASLSAQTNKMLNNLDININEYKIRDFARTSRLENMQLVNGFVITSAKAFIQNKFGIDEYKKWLSTLTPQLYFIVKNKQPLYDWYPLEVCYDNLYKSIVDYFYEGDLDRGIRELVIYSSKAKLPAYIIFIAKILPISVVYEIAASTIVNKYFKPSKIEIVKNRNNTLIVHMGDFETPSKIAELGVYYFIKNFSQKLVSKTAVVEYTKSYYDGDLYTEYIVTWS